LGKFSADCSIFRIITKINLVPKVLRIFQHIVKFKEGTLQKISVPSRVISLNHNVIVEIVEITPRVNKNKPLEYP
jgi:hypothetical protein